MEMPIELKGVVALRMRHFAGSRRHFRLQTMIAYSLEEPPEIQRFADLSRFTCLAHCFSLLGTDSILGSQLSAEPVL